MVTPQDLTHRLKSQNYILNKQYHVKVLLKRFHLNGNTIGFHPQTPHLDPLAKYTVLWERSTKDQNKTNCWMVFFVSFAFLFKSEIGLKKTWGVAQFTFLSKPNRRCTARLKSNQRCLTLMFPKIPKKYVLRFFFCHSKLSHIYEL